MQHKVSLTVNAFRKKRAAAQFIRFFPICSIILPIDTVKPIIFNIPRNITQHTDHGLPTATVNWIEPTAVDNSGIQTLTSTHTPGFSFDIGVTIVTYLSVDFSGLETAVSFSVTVKSNIILNNVDFSDVVPICVELKMMDGRGLVVRTVSEKIFGIAHI